MILVEETNYQTFQSFLWEKVNPILIFKKDNENASVKRGNVIHFALTLKNDTFSGGDIKLSSFVLNTFRFLLYKKGNWTIYFCEIFRGDRWVQDSTISIGHESKITPQISLGFYEFKVTTSQSSQRHQKLENCKHSAFKNRVSYTIFKVHFDLRPFSPWVFFSQEGSILADV